MFVGIYLPYWLSKRKCKAENFGNYLRKHLLVFTVSATGLAIVLRVIVLSVINYFALPQPYPIGLEMPQEAVLSILAIRCNIQCHSSFIHSTDCNSHNSSGNVESKNTIKKKI